MFTVSFFYLSGPNFFGPLKQLLKKIVVSNPCIEKNTNQINDQIKCENETIKEMQLFSEE